MGEYTSANFGGMAQGESDFLAIYNTLTSALGDLQHNLEGSLSQWTGSARASYTQAKAQWDAAAQHMGAVLKSLGTVIGTANTTYQETERGLTQMWT
ncbi:MAG TPA: WXG100 family type VII secretion target [Streptosporangiaceae bacterium]|nr:WXG100 family type VII secretion target [Streptosporangiaceae bacterium]